MKSETVKKKKKKLTIEGAYELTMCLMLMMCNGNVSLRIRITE